MAVQAAAHDPDQERVHDGARLGYSTRGQRRRLDEVRDVLDDGESQADESAVDESVHDPVELGRGNEEESDDAHELERLLHAGPHDRGAPGSGQIRRDLAQDREPRLVGIPGEARGNDAAPQQSARQHELRLPLEEIEPVHRDGHGQGIREHEEPRHRERLDQAAHSQLFVEEEVAADCQSRDEQPERGLARLDKRCLDSPTGGTRRGRRRVGVHGAALTFETMATTSSDIEPNPPCAMKTWRTTALPSTTIATSSPSTVAD